MLIYPGPTLLRRLALAFIYRAVGAHRSVGPG
jgi:hypothetical protein